MMQPEGRNQQVGPLESLAHRKRADLSFELRKEVGLCNPHRPFSPAERRGDEPRVLFASGSIGLFGALLGCSGSCWYDALMASTAESVLQDALKLPEEDR
ncbi:MAG: hypothetical protein ACHQ4J_09850, partial [Candidatus Binatia bacterium]